MIALSNVQILIEVIVELVKVVRIVSGCFVIEDYHALPSSSLIGEDHRCLGLLLRVAHLELERCLRKNDVKQYASDETIEARRR